ncbi:cupin domain-containing protein [Sphingomonas sp. AOB5]|uniref:cupin domain-containing protein n=1 Tax=Sphingomonas sp. AOB5 TaxID=3034017 RepID=UPI0023F813B4|nr:cupin domain-containing protein [Sphingomonas sp. AOB5]MDF7776306.1 cupin domain-containing protein [Sphingomonas sp. AOB5]
MEFDQVVAPLSREQFLADHHGKSFLRIPGTPGRFAGLIGWDELSAILEQHRLAPPRFKLVQGGQPLDPSRYLSAGLGGTPRLDSAKFATALAGGATLILDAAEELAPRIRALSDSFRDVFRSGNYVNLYAGWFAQNGFDLHWDSQEAMILQLGGRKRWQVFAPTRLHPLQDDVEAPARPTGPPLWDGMLEDGDALYIPRGWWHMAWPVDEPSLHLTFTTVQPNGIDLARWVAATLRRHAELREDLPALDDAAGQAARIASLRTLMSEALSDDLIATFRRQWEAESFPRTRVNLPGGPYQQLAALTDASKVRLGGAHKLAFATIGANAEFVAGGKLYVVPADLVPALALLSDTAAVPVSELVAQVKPERAADLRKALAVLARAGVFLVEQD